jgi:hypothetical protein
MSSDSRRFALAATQRGSHATSQIGSFVALALACSRSEGAPSSPAPGAPEVVVAAATPGPPESAPPPVDDVAAAQRWLDALRDGKRRELEAYTAYPFELHENGGCGSREAASRAELANALGCLSGDAGLLDLLRRHEPSTLERAPERGRTLLDDFDTEATADVSLVTAVVHSAEARLDVVLWIEDGGVRGVWKAGPAGTREIAMATEWLEALEHRDLERLARVTSYPFELRDTGGSEATCGKGRAAQTREQLGKAVECLFRGKFLHQALVDGAPRRPEKQATSAPYSSWAEPWWRPRDHEPLHSVTAFAATREGLYDRTFEMQLLEDDAGVRVFWKIGSRESND